jgi:hypothetical protein
MGRVLFCGGKLNMGMSTVTVLMLNDDGVLVPYEEANDDGDGEVDG